MAPRVLKSIRLFSSSRYLFTCIEDRLPELRGVSAEAYQRIRDYLTEGIVLEICMSNPHILLTDGVWVWSSAVAEFLTPNTQFDAAFVDTVLSATTRNLSRDQFSPAYSARFDAWLEDHLGFGG